ncbi:MAG: hypothetical protein ACRD82_04525, partial [Blastocatellia bacterium]
MAANNTHNFEQHHGAYQAPSEAWSGAEAGFPNAALRDALNRTMRDSLKPIAMTVSAVYIGAFITIYIFPPASGTRHLYLTFGIMAVVFLVVSVLLQRWEIPLDLAHPMAALFGVSGCISCNLVLLVNAEPYQATNFMLLTIAAGALLLSTRWLLFVLTMVWAGMFSLAWLSISSPQWPHFGFCMLVATMLALVIHAVRVRGLQRMESLRMQ